ncbi:hypothetical protein H5410_036342 [Solanum commersonii]|uniref:Uncharacterized protein n=1 Tax=Solanum commersonii TaxID=4109 RepID=A0A9J5Y7W0_SOLCO|nr:hypothetical protein H5410_036342 [Solanum commersonii]
MEMSSGGEGDRSREHLGISQPNKTEKKKSRRLIDHEDIPGFFPSAPERITHDTYLITVPFADHSASLVEITDQFCDLPFDRFHRSLALSFNIVIFGSLGDIVQIHETAQRYADCSFSPLI